MTVSPFLEELRAEAWAMEPRHLTALAEKAAALSLDFQARLPGFGLPLRLPEPTAFQLKGKTAIVPIQGTLMRSVPSWYRWLGIEATALSSIKQGVDAAAADPRVETIVLRIDSPGGQAQGVQEVGDAIHAAAQKKTVCAVVDGMCASGAYWLASQADSISAPEDAFVGSIGVYQVWADFSKAAANEGVVVHVVRSGEHKGMGVMGAPITENQLKATQDLVDGFAALFHAAVARGREISIDHAAGAATGQLWLASAAKTHGLVDAVEPVARALSRLAPEEAPMADKNDTHETALEQARAADRKRLADLKVAFPDDLPFAVAQFEAGASLESAKAAYADVLRDKLQKSEAARTEATTALEAEKKKKHLPAPAGGTPVKQSVDPSAAAEPEGEDEHDFMALSRAYAAEHKCSMTVAMRMVAAQDPEGHRSWVAAQPRRRRDRTAYARRDIRGNVVDRNASTS